MKPRSVALRCSQGCGIALGASIPVSVALDNVLIALLALCWLAAGGFREQWARLRRNPVAGAALLLLGYLALGLAWSADHGAGGHTLGKYADLLLLPLLALPFAAIRERRRGLAALAAALAVSLAVSVAAALGGIPENALVPAAFDNPVAFKLSVTHGWLMALGAFGCGVAALHAGPGRRRWLLTALAALFVVDVLWWVQGRTGYAVAAVLLIYFCAAAGGRRGAAAAVLLTVLLGSGAYWSSATFQQRLDRAAAEFRAWRAGGAIPESSSIGQRLEFYRVSIAAVAERPLMGFGTGSFPKVYRERAGADAVATDNPHNDYLLLAVQGGIPAAALYLLLLGLQWRWAARLPDPGHQALARGLVLAMGVGSLFNSFLLDHTEGLLYAWLGGLLFAGLPPGRERMS